MEITFLWSWLSFWVGFASVFVVLLAIVIVLSTVQGLKRKDTDLMGLEDWASRLK